MRLFRFLVATLAACATVPVLQRTAGLVLPKSANAVAALRCARDTPLASSGLELACSLRVPPSSGDDDAVRHDPAVAGEVLAHDIDIVEAPVRDR